MEPSYVIRKFLDAQRINNLTLYLEALHERHYAGPDHTTLLLNCYTKLKEDEKLRRYGVPVLLYGVPLLLVWAVTGVYVCSGVCGGLMGCLCVWRCRCGLCLLYMCAVF